MAVIHEIYAAYLAKSNLSLAAGVLGEELVNCAVVGWLAGSVVVMACKDYFVTESQGLAPAASRSSGVEGFGNL